MGGLVAAIKGAVGLGNQGQSDVEPGAGGKIADSAASLQYTLNKWDDRKNAYVVY